MATLTTSNGNPVDDNQNSLTAGQYGPILLQDFHLIDKLAHFDRERVPERVVHAKGAGAHGYFEVTADVTHLTKAKFLNQVGKRTPVFLRFSTVGGEKGSADTDRDPRGFALKFYTEVSGRLFVRVCVCILNWVCLFFVFVFLFSVAAGGQLGHDGQQHARVLHPRPLKVPRLYPHPEAQPPHQPQGPRRVLGLPLAHARDDPPGRFDFFSFYFIFILFIYLFIYCSSRSSSRTAEPPTATVSSTATRRTRSSW